MNTIYELLAGVDVSGFISEKNINRKGQDDPEKILDYLSWSTVQHLLGCLLDNVYTSVVLAPDQTALHKAGTGGMVRVQVVLTLGHEQRSHQEHFPVMDHRMNSLAYEDCKSTDVNYAIKRGFVKAVGHLGLGLKLWEPEGLPSVSDVRRAATPLEPRLKEIRQAVQKANTVEQLLEIHKELLFDEHKAVGQEIKDKGTKLNKEKK